MRSPSENSSTVSSMRSVSEEPGSIGRILSVTLCSNTVLAGAQAQCATAAGVKGHPLPPEARLSGTAVNSRRSLCGAGVEDSPLALQIPAFWRGASGKVSRLDTISSDISRRPGLGALRALPLCTPPPGCPWTRLDGAGFRPITHSPRAQSVEFRPSPFAPSDGPAPRARSQKHRPSPRPHRLRDGRVHKFFRASNARERFDNELRVLKSPRTTRLRLRPPRPRLRHRHPRTHHHQRRAPASNR